MLFVQGADEVAELRAEDALHRPLLGRDYVHLEAAGTQRGGHFQADEAGAQHDGAARRARASDHGAAVTQRAQRVNVRQIHAG